MINERAMLHENASQTLFATQMDDARRQDLQALQPTFADLKVLAIITKQLHWNVVGRHFKPIHEHLDEIYAEVEGFVDEVAERIVAVGYSPNGQVSDLGTSELPEVPLGFLKDDIVLEHMGDRLGRVAKVIRQRMAEIEDVDTATADLLHGIVLALEKQHWMIQAQRV